MARTPAQQLSEATRWRGYWKAKGFTLHSPIGAPVVLSRPDCRIEYRRGGWHVDTVEGLAGMRSIGRADMLLAALKLVH